MIYVQLRARVKLAQGETLHVADAANVLGSEKAGHCSLFCPTAWNCCFFCTSSTVF